MRIAYFDCFSGISGDMILGALIDLGLNPEILSDQLTRVPLSGYRLEVKRERRGALEGTRVRVNVEGKQPSRSCEQIRRLLLESALPSPVKEASLAVLRRLAEVEGRLHGQTPQEVGLHEVGAVDSIVDVVGACIALHCLGIERVTASPLPLGRGFVRCQHGLLPLPAPATLALLRGVPVFDSGQQRELVTPTGAAILTAVTSEFAGFPAMRVERAGYGVGEHPESHPPNLLRVVLGERSSPLIKERLLLVETSIDDMNPEFYSHLLERLLAAGALDVNLVPVQMKKGRPGQLLRILLPGGLQESILQILFSETTSLGVRLLEVERYSLPRHTLRVQTSYGRLAVKLAVGPEGDVSLAPEYDSCQRAAQRWGVPLRRVYEAALTAARQRLRRDEARRKKTPRKTSEQEPID